MVGKPFEILKVFLRIVPLIENQSDALTFLSEHLVASDQIVQNPAEGDRVVLVRFDFPGALLPFRFLSVGYGETCCWPFRLASHLAYCGAWV